ncbi:helix-turn-helix transcriptional regulator [Hirschia maritima]|uniref:helix-turn-helix transcriptional regulator n=1 Tax=Hirschia maritima TaxID=1121961 RepID=UPI0003604671|nr:autoinducer binding domain-containing protein [Hirschia maritima]
MSNLIAEKTFKFAQQASNCMDVPELGRCFQELVKPHGVVASSAWAVIGGDAKLSRGFGEWPREWARYYREKRYFEVDPVFAALIKGNDAGYWDEQIAHSIMTKEAQQVMDDAKKFGYSDGYSRLIPTLNGSYYLVSLYGNELDRDPDVRIMFDLASTKFVQEGVLLLNRRVGKPLRDHDLTARQIEVLQSKADGNTDRSTADQLGISVKAVEAHLTNIRKQFSARSTSQAITMAREKGLISSTFSKK